MDHAITDYIKHQRRVLIGERTAERLKMVLGSATTRSRITRASSRGRTSAKADLKMIEVSSLEVHRGDWARRQTDRRSRRDVLERIPPEVAGDIHDTGLVPQAGSPC